MTEELPDAEANEKWLVEHRRLLAEFRQLADMPCPTNKHKHATKAEARAHVQSVRSRTGDKTRTSAFPCGYCGFWHIGRR